MESESHYQDQSDEEKELEVLDSEWFKEFKELTFEAYEYLIPDKSSMTEQKTKFFAGETDTPKFSYPQLQPEELDKKEQQLIALKAKIKFDSTERVMPISDRSKIEVAKQAYHWRINQMIAEVRMLKAAATGDNKKFARYSGFVYGSAQPEIYQFIVDYTKGMVKGVDQQDRSLADAGDSLLKALPEVSSANEAGQINDPEPEDMDTAIQVTEVELNDLIGGPKSEMLSADQIADGFNEALSRLKADGWLAVVDRESGRVNMGVSQKDQRVYIPESRKMLATEFQQFVAHEIGTHVARRVNGEKSRLKLLGLGLDRYEPGEEGIATMREQALAGKVEGFKRHTLYLGISLATGLDGGGKRNFRQVYDCLEKYNLFLQIADGVEPAEAQKKAQDLAWIATVRIFRGTDGSGEACFTKDIAYLEGNIGVWDVISKKTGEIHRFSVGKYSPMNERHIAILDRLGVGQEEVDQKDEKPTSTS